MAKKTETKKKNTDGKTETAAHDIETGAIVLLTQKHENVEPGKYTVEGYNAEGNPILKTESGRIDVPLELIEVIKPGKKGKVSNKAHKDKQQTFIKDDDKDFYIDPYGQMTINKIDTPLGKLAQRIIQGSLDIRRIEVQMTEDEDVMMKEMKKQKVTKITVLGHRIDYQEAKTTNPKLIIKDLE